MTRELNFVEPHRDEPFDAIYIQHEFQGGFYSEFIIFWRGRWRKAVVDGHGFRNIAESYSPGRALELVIKHCNSLRTLVRTEIPSQLLRP